MTLKRTILSTLAVALLYSGVCARAVTQNGNGPLEKGQLIAALKQRALSKEELIEEVNVRGVSFRLSAIDEQDIRRVGKYLGKPALDELLTYIRIKYRPESVNESLLLPMGSPATVDYLGFTATYTGNEPGGYHLIATYPDNGRLEITTRKGCEHGFKWRGRELIMSIADITAAGVNIRLTEKSSSPIAIKPIDSPPAKISKRISPCITISFQLVVGNHTSDESLVISPYYISEPLNVEVLRLYVARNPSKTPIPAGAKDSEPIKAIYYEDALGIAKMIGAELPTVVEWINAYYVDGIIPKSNRELIGTSEARLATIENIGRGNTYLSNEISEYYDYEHITHQPAKGFLRVVIQLKNLQQ